MTFAALLLTLVPLAADAPSPDPAALIRRLGDPAFEVREAANQALRALGLAAEPALEAGTHDADVEVRAQCFRLLTQVREADRKARIQTFLDDADDRSMTALPGWERFRSVVGPTATRKLFAGIYSADPTFLDVSAKEPKKAGALVAERAKSLAAEFLQPQRDRAALTTLPALLLVASDPRVTVEPGTLNALYSGLNILAHREALRNAFLADPGRAPLVLAVLQRGSEAVHRVTLPLAGELELTGAREWGQRLATTLTIPAATRALAILMLARLGDPADVAMLSPLLSDRTAVGSITLGPIKLNAELADVALAAILHLKGESLAEYGFPYFQAVPGLKTLPSAERLGFTDTASRTAAFKKWQDAIGRVRP